MALEYTPQIVELDNEDKIWTYTFEKFEAKVYLPKCDLYTDIINYGFMTPYLLVFEQKKLSLEEAALFAEEKGLADIAREYGGSVVFIYPTNEGGWEKAPEDLFASLISETKISQYYKDNASAVLSGNIC